jgi:hypothetical protein
MSVQPTQQKTCQLVTAASHMREPCHRELGAYLAASGPVSLMTRYQAPTEPPSPALTYSHGNASSKEHEHELKTMGFGSNCAAGFRPAYALRPFASADRGCSGW